MSDYEDDDTIREVARLRAKWRAGVGVDSERSGVAAFESKSATGFRRIGGKRVAADGLVSRGGYRRIFPDHDDDDWADFFMPGQVEELEKTARAVLRGRSATVFNKLVVAPLRGKTRSTVEELAEELSIPKGQIRKIKYDATTKVKERISAMRLSAEVPTNSHPCGMCGRVIPGTHQTCQTISIPEVRGDCLATARRNGVYDKAFAKKLDGREHRWAAQFDVRYLNKNGIAKK